jgi:hypothetical protein
LLEVRRLHLKFDCRRILGDHRWKHLKNNYQSGLANARN